MSVELKCARSKRFCKQLCWPRAFEDLSRFTSPAGSLRGALSQHHALKKREPSILGLSVAEWRHFRQETPSD